MGETWSRHQRSMCRVIFTEPPSRGALVLARYSSSRRVDRAGHSTLCTASWEPLPATEPVHLAYWLVQMGRYLEPTEAGGKKCRGIPIYNGCGTIYEITQPPERAEHVLYRFTGGTDGIAPYGLSALVLNGGSLYGSAFLGGSFGDCIYDYACGVSFKLTPTGTALWDESVTWAFGQGSDGAEPTSGFIFDKSGNMYGTTIAGGDGTACNVQGHSGCGIVYELSPSGAGWTQTVLYDFLGGTDGGAPYPGVIFDQSGNLYGATAFGGSRGGGTIYELSPSGSGWTFTLLYSFAGSGGGPNGQCFDCPGAYSSLTMGGTGNLYGTTLGDGAHGLGMAFELARSGTGWTFTDLHDFTGGSDGGTIWSGLVRDSSGNLYGSASSGGANGFGVIFEITP